MFGYQIANTCFSEGLVCSGNGVFDIPRNRAGVQQFMHSATLVLALCGELIVYFKELPMVVTFPAIVVELRYSGTPAACIGCTLVSCVPTA